MKHTIQKLSAVELENQLEVIVRFLETVHPSLKNSDGYRPSVELRPLVRGVPKDSKDYFPLKWSLNIWDLSEETITRIRKFLSRHNGQQTCLFYSVFTYNNKKEVHTKEGVPAKSGKITSAAALYAEELALDFDHIGFEEYTKLVDRFEELGIYALWTFSGHGYQAHILLDRPLEDKELLKKFVYKFRSKGFNCDAKCVDPARIMRLPGTFNNKCFVEDEYASERISPPKCVLVQEAFERYNLDYILEKLNSLPTVSIEDEKAYRNVSAEQLEISTFSQSSSEVSPVPGADEISLKRLEYPYITKFELPSPLAKMLSNTPKGYRNHALGFMIGFFSKEYKLGKKQVKEILEIWSANACSPAYNKTEFEEDFERIYYKYNGLSYDPSLAKKFGSIDFNNIKLTRKNHIHIPHKFFHDFSNLKGKEIRLYLAIKMLEYKKKDTTQEALSKELGISERALRPSLQNLIKRGHCFQRKGNSRQGIPNTYHSSHLISAEDGYTTFPAGEIKLYLNDLCEQTDRTRANGELVLYLFFCWKFYTKEFFMSQSNLGKKTGLTQQAISQIIARLQEREYIEVKKIRRGSLLEYCEYRMLM